MIDGERVEGVGANSYFYTHGFATGSIEKPVVCLKNAQGQTNVHTFLAALYKYG